MSKKLTIAAVEQAAKSSGIDDEQRRALLEMLADMTAPESDEEKPLAVKKQFVVVLADPTGKYAAIMKEEAIQGWVVQIPEEASPASAPSRIKDAAHHFNSTKRGRLMPVQTLGEACENVPGRIAKDHGLWIKTKATIYAIPAANELPDTPSVLGDDRGSYETKTTEEKQ